MSFPDTEDRAKEVEQLSPLAADRLRQYERLCKTFEAQIAELHAANSALFQQLAQAAKDNGDLLTERDTLKQQIPETPVEPQPDRLAEIEARLAKLETASPAESTK